MFDPDQMSDVADLVRKLVADGIDDLDGATAARIALDARRAREILDWIEVHALGQLETSKHTDIEHGLTTAGWFAREADLPSGVARTQVNTARALRHLDVTADAWLDGTINAEHVRVLAGAANPRIRDQVVAAQGDLIDLTDRTTFHRWRQGINALVSSWDQDGPDPTDPANSTASWSRSGAFAVLRAQFGGDVAEVLGQILDAKTDELFHRQKNDRSQSTDIAELTRNQLRGLALAELMMLGAGIDLTTTKAPGAEVHLVLRNGLPSLYADDDEASWPTPPSFTDPGWSLTNLDGHHLALEHFATLLCDCTIHPVLVDAHGNPLELGRAVHCAPPKLRRAVLIRDGGCTFPGCDAPIGWIDIHHLQRFTDGGLTDLDNLTSHQGIPLVRSDERERSRTTQPSRSGSTRSASSSDATKRAMMSALERRSSAIVVVEQLPPRSHTALGGGPSTKASWRKSESLETIT